MVSIEVIFKSPRFTFLLGPAQEEMPIPIELFKNKSQPLYALMTDGMKESQESKAKLEETDAETFAAAIEFALDGYYKTRAFAASKPKKIEVRPEKDRSNKRKRDSTIITVDTTNAEQSFPGGNRTIHCNNCNRCVAPLGCRLCKHELTREDAQDSLQRDRMDEYLCSAPSAIILGLVDRLVYKVRHFETEGDTAEGAAIYKIVKVYVLADLYAFVGLKELSLVKLWKDLSIFDPAYGNNIEGLVSAIRYAYKHTAEDVNDMMNSLRKLLTRYAAGESSILLKHSTFEGLLKEEGDFGADFSKAIAGLLK